MRAAPANKCFAHADVLANQREHQESAFRGRYVPATSLAKGGHQPRQRPKIRSGIVQQARSITNSENSFSKRPRHETRARPDAGEEGIEERPVGLPAQRAELSALGVVHSS